MHFSRQGTALPSRLRPLPVRGTDSILRSYNITLALPRLIPVLFARNPQARRFYSMGVAWRMREGKRFKNNLIKLLRFSFSLSHRPYAREYNNIRCLTVRVRCTLRYYCDNATRQKFTAAHASSIDGSVSTSSGSKRRPWARPRRYSGARQQWKTFAAARWSRRRRKKEEEKKKKKKQWSAAQGACRAATTAYTTCARARASVSLLSLYRARTHITHKL